eukprot:1154231-Pelagomonas_calceolata.AAC.1
MLTVKLWIQCLLSGLVEQRAAFSGDVWRLPHDVPAAYGGLVIGQVWSSWDASLRQGNLSSLPCKLSLAGVSAWCSFTESLLKAEGVA